MKHKTSTELIALLSELAVERALDRISASCYLLLREGALKELLRRER